MKIYQYDIIRKTQKFVLSQPEVRDVKIYRDCQMNVAFKDGIYEHWIYNDRISSKNKLRTLCMKISDYPYDDEFPIIGHAAASTPGSFKQDLRSVFIGHKYLRKFKFCNVRIFLHRLALYMADRGYINIPCHVNLDTTMSYVRSRILNACRIGRRLYLEHPIYRRMISPYLYYALGDYVDGFKHSWSAMRLFKSIERLHRRGRNLSQYNIVRMMKRKYGINISVFGYPISFATMIQDQFGGAPIYDDTNTAWMHVVSMINGTTHNDEDGVFITNKLSACGGRPMAVYMGESDIGEQVICRILQHNPFRLTIIKNKCGE